MDANLSNTVENATIEIDTQGDTVEDPIILDESTSNSDSDSAQDADKSTVDPGFPFRLTPMSFALRVTNSP